MSWMSEREAIASASACTAAARGTRYVANRRQKLNHTETLQLRVKSITGKPMAS